MYNFLLNNAGIIGIVFTVIFGIPSVILMYQAIFKKKLFYKIQSINKLKVLSNQLVANGIQYIYNSNPLNNPVLIVVKFIHSGNQPIKETDFRNEIEIKLNNGLIPVATNVKVSDTRFSFGAHIKVDDFSIVVDKFLLNQRETFEVSIIADMPINNDISEENIGVDARIEGIRKIRNITNKQRSSNMAAIYLSIINVIIFIFIVLSLFITGHLPKGISQVLTTIVGFSLLTYIMTSAILAAVTYNTLAQPKKSS